MGLRTKFNLVIFLAFSIGLALAGFVFRDIVYQNAWEEVSKESRIMMGSAAATRDYTSEEVRPLLLRKTKTEFVPQIVSAYAAKQHFAGLRKSFPEYSYKEAALNPTNLNDRATEWEAEVIYAFRNDPANTEFIFERDTPSGPVLTLARPIQAKDQGCLLCHGRVEDAPKAMIDIYGTSNGFGWKLNEIIGAQIVSVPMSVPLQRAQSTFVVFMALLLGVFFAVAVLINVLLHIVVINPVVKMSEIASQVSTGRMDAPEYEKKGKDEVASLSISFNRMRRSVENAIRLLEE